MFHALMCTLFRYSEHSLHVSLTSRLTLRSLTVLHVGPTVYTVISHSYPSSQISRPPHLCPPLPLPSKPPSISPPTFVSSLAYNIYALFFIRGTLHSALFPPTSPPHFCSSLPPPILYSLHVSSPPTSPLDMCLHINTGL